MKLDLINKRLLKELQANARISNTELGRRIGISSPAISERLKKLEDLGLIKGYGAQISYQDLGYQLKAIITLKAFMGKLKPFLEKVVTYKEVINCYRVTGNENIVMEVVLKNQAHLEKLIDELITYGECKTQVVLSKVVDNNPIVPA